jgi:lysophospholipase L1-like esterase
VTVKAKGNFTTGRNVKSFVVMPVKNTVKSLSSPKAGKIKVSWNKDSNAQGYHVLYSTDKNFKKNVYHSTILDTNKTSQTITDSHIVKGKTYYVKVRSFIRVGGKVYGAYGKAKSVKIPSQGYGLVEKSKAVDKSYFNDAAFVGDSISLKLSQYQSSTSSLGKAKFFAAGSLSAANALWPVSSKSVHPRYNGVKTKVEDCIQKSGAKKVYIMLGMNDIGAYGLDKSIQNYKTLISRIKAKSPNVTIFIQSMTPLASTSRSSGRNLNNTNIKKYNEMLKKMCEENHWYFVDVGSVMYDSSGKYLNPSYCSDPNSMGMHFTTAGCKQWVNYLMTHTVEL